MLCCVKSRFFYIFKYCKHTVCKSLCKNIFLHDDKTHLRHSSNFASPMCREHGITNCFIRCCLWYSCMQCTVCRTGICVSIKENWRDRTEDKLLPLHVNWCKTLKVNWKHLTSLSVALRWEEWALALFWFIASAFVPWTL